MHTAVLPVLLEEDNKIQNVFAFSHTLKHLKMKTYKSLNKVTKEKNKRLYMNNIPY